jgi:hypothetical protein
VAATPDDLYQSKLLDAVKYRQQKEESKLKSSVDYAITRNPDIAAKDQANARQMDLPIDFAIKNSDKVDKAARRQQILENLKGTPVLKRLMEDAEFAAVAQDDHKALAELEKSVSIGDMATAVGKETALQWALTKQGIRAMWSAFWGEEEAPAPTEAEMLRDYDAAEYLRQQEGIGSLGLSMTGEAVLSGISSLLTQAPAYGASFVLGGPIGLAGMSILVGAEAWLKYRSRGATKEEAAIGTAFETSIEYLGEKMPMGYFEKMFGKTSWKKYLVGILEREVPTELAQENLQNLVDTMVANPDKTLADWRDEIGETSYRTLIATIVHSGIMSVGSGALNEAANRFGGGIAMADTALEEHELLATQVEYVENVLGAENAVYMAPEDAQAFFQSHPEIMDTLPEDTRKSITEALTAELDVSIPKADYLTYFTDFHEEIADILRNDMDGMTAAEAIRFAEGG